VAVLGSRVRAIALNLGIAATSASGETNTLNSVTISSIPSGATLSNTNGDPLTITGGSITFDATQLAAGVLNGLKVTPATDHRQPTAPSGSPSPARSSSSPCWKLPSASFSSPRCQREVVSLAGVTFSPFRTPAASCVASKVMLPPVIVSGSPLVLLSVAPLGSS